MTTYFISGHMNLTEQEFHTHYVPKIQEAAVTNPESFFVIGNARGADTMSLHELLRLGVKPTHIKVYIYCHNSKTRKNEMKRLIALGVLITIGPPIEEYKEAIFESVTDRDYAMTEISDKDIAWVRPAEEQRVLLGDKYDPNHKTGTEINLLRRHMIGHM